MPAKDTFHQAMRRALEKDGWTITHDPLLLYYELGKLYVDLGAEKMLAAEQGDRKIAVEVKSFLQNSAISEFHTALGQYLSYRILLQEQYPERILYLAVPLDTYTSFFPTQLARGIVSSCEMKLIVYSPTQEVIDRWIN